MNCEIIQGDCLEVMRSYPDNHFSCICTDPPYGLHFMGKGWDHFKKSNFDEKSDKHFTEARGWVRAVGCANSEAGAYDDKRNDEFQSFITQFATEALRIVKPGGHMLMFGAPRRYHRQGCGIEDAGWEIRDSLMWIFGSGFPKSHNHFGIGGYGTALKPAYEPVIMAMKPCDGTFKQNAEKWGQAGINIDACRIRTNDKLGGGANGITSIQPGWDRPWKHNDDQKELMATRCKSQIEKSETLGRWPANAIFDEEAAKMLDEQTIDKIHPSGRSTAGNHDGSMFSGLGNADLGNRVDYPDKGGASRFFYCPKASPSERNEGLEGLPIKQTMGGGGINNTPDDVCGKYGSIKAPQKNNHPTVKPLKLMEYLIKLIMPPKDGILLDPFAGSGTTILAAHRLGIKALGIEKQPEYAEIARARLEHAKIEKKSQLDLFESCG